MIGKLANRPKAATIVILIVVMLFTGIAGGALGNEFGGGFLGAPMPHIQLAAEPVLATPIFGNFIVTNTMVAGWVAIIVLALISFFGTRHIGEVPGRLQNILEIIFEFFLGLAETVAGPEKARRFLPLVMTIFLFVVTSNWLGILPGFGTIGRFETAEEVIHHKEESAGKKGEHADLSKIKLQEFNGTGPIVILPMGLVKNEITAEKYEEDKRSGVSSGKRAGLLVPFLRSANTDLNTTLAIAIVAMVMVHWWGVRILGGLVHLRKFITLSKGPIGLFVGILEGISEVARVISFTFRLFGNIFAGEVLLFAMAFLVPLVGLVPFLGLELFVGLIQAFIFSMLTLVFAATATVGHDAEGH